ncbi:HK97 family phage prohead protease [Parageobacillus toebii]|uniref:HK97 family phage prohead protease n=1 Tax=Parageobacillus toebii TaxID=153151 RepID=UPI001966D0F3|nr:HK97 family phage prohead protease [Parageobacillus toebii]QSB48772.1 HK97 family phage prohead protease [Parageobacillus toebii]
MGVDNKQKMKETKEIRALPVTLEIREAGEEEGTRTIKGAIKYNTESQVMRDWWGDKFVEEIAAGAFDESLRTRGVVGLWSHDTSKVLGSTKSGTLRLESTEKELRFELDLPNTTVGNDAWEMIKRGDVDGVSFGMRVTKDKWSQIERNGEKIYKRSILDAELYEISPVAFPAYPANEVSVRSLDEYREQQKRASNEYKKRKLLMELELM